jgi:hyperosmotically inducible periplasmic protein
MKKRFFRTLVRTLSMGAVTVVMASAAAPMLGAQSAARGETTMAVERALRRLPYYGVFDFLSYGLERGTVTLAGYAYRGNLRTDASRAVKRLSGVDEVANRIEVLPASQEDDRIRWGTFSTIYTDDFLSRYAPGGEMGARREVVAAAQHPGMQPFGTYPIHIIVKNGRTTLVGLVDNESDKTLAGVRAREVPLVRSVTNDLEVRGK